MVVWCAKEAKINSSKVVQKEYNYINLCMENGVFFHKGALFTNSSIWQKVKNGLFVCYTDE